MGNAGESKKQKRSFDNGSKPRSGNWQQDVRWINPYLGDTDIKWLEDNEPELTHIVMDFVDELPETYHLSSKPDTASPKFLAVLICSGDGDPNAGIALSIRGSTRVDALYALAYYVAHKMAWKLGTAAGSSGTSRWG